MLIMPTMVVLLWRRRPRPAGDGWQVVKHKQWWRVHRPLPPPQPRHPVLADLVGRGFNCLRPDHVAVVYLNAPHCLWCHWEGHLAHACKRPRSPDSTVLPPCQPCLADVLVLNPRAGDVAWAERRASPGCSRSLQASVGGPSLEASTSRHVLPSLPPSPLPLRDPCRRPRFELRVIPCTEAMDAAEAQLGLALVAMVGGSHLQLRPERA
jgi:hypothetical protein